ncbi:hypothetical protein [Rubinisphaera margarita]|uniref:hypothetical protein n=1 Tax=Rubinisphaera margarita TaxID=2909586 RepID=UPI001EE7A247|nr:hypothetical protein [Rubinisphaera margarita]MCG6154530.1 hypothetical protein [Rubinisphaera margarita]
MTRTPIPATIFSLRPVRQVACLLMMGAVIGCGSSTYEERLEFTKTYYDFIDRLNQNLGPVFSNYGVSVRPPKQFREIAAPAPTPRRPAEGAEGEAEPVEERRDPRQPINPPIDLPGLIAAWTANLNVVDSAGGTTQQPGYLYLLSNYDYWRTFKTKDELGDPLKFHEDVMNTLVDELQIPLDNNARGTATDRVNKWFNVSLPESKDAEFAPQKEFTAITLVPETVPEADEFGAPEEGPPPPGEYQVYLYQNGDMRIVLVYALPRNVSAGENLQKRIELSLQTIDLTTEKPAAAPAARPNGQGTPANGAAPASTQPRPASPF